MSTGTMRPTRSTRCEVLPERCGSACCIKILPRRYLARPPNGRTVARNGRIMTAEGGSSMSRFLRNAALAALTVAAAGAVASAASAQSYDRLVVFGDSLSDNGNLYA